MNYAEKVFDAMHDEILSKLEAAYNDDELGREPWEFVVFYNGLDHEVYILDGEEAVKILADKISDENLQKVQDAMEPGQVVFVAVKYSGDGDRGVIHLCGIDYELEGDLN